MAAFHFHQPIQVRYADMDAQGHLNNARYLTYLEQARVGYLLELGLWDGKSFNDIGLIVGDVHVRYLAPILITQRIRVDMSVTHIGNKSLTFTYQVVDDETGQICATAETVQVAYDYHTQSTIPVPARWREKIGAFEGRDFPSKTEIPLPKRTS